MDAHLPIGGLNAGIGGEQAQWQGYGAAGGGG